MIIQNILKTSIYLSLVFSSIALQAATVTWNGGFGFWNQASRWSTGTVPGVNDQVVINSGFVIIPQNFNARAKGVQVNSNSAFRIEFNAQLDLNDGDIDVPALKNDGITFNFGTIAIDNYFGSNPNYHVGLNNANFFRNFSAGEIIITNTNNKAVNNGVNANFINEGLINTNLSIIAWNTGVGNIGSFENRQSGIIVCSNGFHGVYSTSLASKFDNRGKITIINSDAVGFNSDTEGHNFNTGTIQLVGCAFHNGDHFINDGVINISNYSSANGSGLTNTDYFENYGSISISNSGVNGIYNHIYSNSFPVFDNDGTITISQNPKVSIFNEGMVFNFPNGYIETDKRLKDGELINYGVFKSTYNGGILHSCVLTNKGLFNDKYKKLSSNLTTNHKIIVGPIQGPIISGQAISDVLDVGGTSGIIFGQWKNQIYNGNSCGLYLAGLNRFIPNSYATNDAEIHGRFIISAVGNDRWLDIVVLNASNSIVHNQDIGLSNKPKEVELLPRYQNEDLNQFKVYPNPCASIVNISHSPNIKMRSIELYDLSGKLMLIKELENGQQISALKVPENLVNGSYLILLKEGDKRIGMERLVVFR